MSHHKDTFTYTNVSLVQEKQSERNLKKIFPFREKKIYIYIIYKNTLIFFFVVPAAKKIQIINKTSNTRTGSFEAKSFRYPNRTLTQIMTPFFASRECHYYDWEQEFNFHLRFRCYWKLFRRNLYIKNARNKQYSRT